MHWLNEPPEWQQTDSGLSLTTAGHTDFWRHTHHGFVRDSGHAYLEPVDADFSAEVYVQADYAALYDQAGLLLRLSETHWIKAGVEFVGGQAHLSAVVTRGQSDWSVRPCPAAEGGVRLRLTRRADAVLIETALPGEGWQLLRRRTALGRRTALRPSRAERATERTARWNGSDGRAVGPSLQ